MVHYQTRAREWYSNSEPQVWCLRPSRQGNPSSKEQQTIFGRNSPRVSFLWIFFLTPIDFVSNKVFLSIFSQLEAVVEICFTKWGKDNFRTSQNHPRQKFSLKFNLKAEIENGDSLSWGWSLGRIGCLGRKSSQETMRNGWFTNLGFSLIFHLNWGALSHSATAPDKGC